MSGLQGKANLNPIGYNIRSSVSGHCAKGNCRLCTKKNCAHDCYMCSAKTFRRKTPQSAANCIDMISPVRAFS